MFNTVSGEQYLKIIDFSKTIYQKCVLRRDNPELLNKNIEQKNLRIKHAFNKYKGNFNDNEKKLLKLNLLVEDNKQFADIFQNACILYLHQSDLDMILSLYKHRKYSFVDEWSKIYHYLMNIFNLSESDVIYKIEEILTFPHMYYEVLKWETTDSVKIYR